ncbi:MAG: WD40 repeat domain-containing protein [Cyanobacteria bacterium P01_G01_bin.54]
MTPLPLLTLATPIAPLIAQAPPQPVAGQTSLVLHQTLEKGHQTRVTALQFYPQLPHLLISGGGKNDGQVMIWNWQTGKQYQDDRAQGTGIESLAVSHDGRWLVTTGVDRRIHFWTLPDGEFSHTLNVDFYNLLALAISPDARILISGGLDGIRLWDLHNSRSLYTLARFLPVTQLALHPEGQWLISGTTQGTIQRWDITTGQRQQTWQAHDQGVKFLALSPDGSTLVTVGQDATIHLWEPKTGTKLHTLDNPDGTVGAIAFHPHQPHLLTSTQNHLYLWNWQTGEPLDSWPSLHTHWLSALSVSPDGHWLASGADNGEIKIWQWQSLPLLTPDPQPSIPPHPTP